MMRIDWEKDCPNVTRAARAIIRFLRAIGRDIRTIFRYSWKPALSIVIVLAAVHGIATFILGKKVEAEIAKIRARGEYVSCVELNGPKIPDSENGAVLYEKTFKIIKRLLPDSPPSGDSYDAVLTPNKATPKAWAEAQKVPDKFKEVFVLAEQAAAVPKCWLKSDWSDGFFAPFPQYRYFRDLGRLCCVRSVVLARQGKVDDALKSLDLGIRVSEALKSDPGLLQQYQRRSIIFSVCRALQDIAARNNIKYSAECRKLFDTLSHIDLLADYPNAVKGERACGLLLYDQIRKHKIDLNKEDPNTIEWLAPMFKFKSTYIGRPWLYSNELDYLRKMEKVINASSRPYYEFEEAIGDINSDSTFDLSGCKSFASLVIPAYRSSTALINDGQTQISECQIFLALMAYHSRFNRYPATLQELKSTLGWNVPMKDLFSGKEFKYKPKGKGFLLYSIGPNLKDDGGVPAKDEAKQLNEGVIVWKMDH